MIYNKNILIIILLGLMTSLNAYSFLGGTGVDGGNSAYQYAASSWCQSTKQTLINYQKRAKIKLNNSGSYSEANKILINGLVASSRKESNQQTFTKKSIERALNLVEALNIVNEEPSSSRHFPLNYFLNGYYDFILKEVVKLDLDIFIPYEYGSPVNNSIDIMDLESRFRNYAREQLDWANKALAVQTIINGTLEIMSVGNGTSIYLKTIQSLSYRAAEDLETSIFRSRYACVIGSLRDLSSQLEDYNLGNREMFEDKRLAINIVYDEVKHIINALKLSNSCDYNRN